VRCQSHGLHRQGPPGRVQQQPAIWDVIADTVEQNGEGVPALPKVPFLIIGGLFFSVGWALRNTPNRAEREATRVAEAAAAPAAELPTPRDAALDALALDPLELAIGFGLVPLVDEIGTHPPGSLLARVKTIRRQIASELGMVIPAVRIRPRGNARTSRDS